MIKYITPLLLCCCSAEYGRSYNLYMDSALSSMAQEQIIRAADQWTEKTGVKFHIDYSPCYQARGDYNICVINSNLAQVREVCKVSNAVECADVTSYTADTYIYVADDRYSPDNPRYLHAILHELGHSLGLQHTNNIDDIMFPIINDKIELSENDINQYKSLRK